MRSNAKRRRIAIVCEDLSYGGVQKCAARLAEAWSRYYDVSFIHFDYKDRPPVVSLSQKIKVISLEQPPISFWRTLKILWLLRVAFKGLVADGPILLVCFLPHMSMYARLASFGLAVKVIATEHLYPAFEFSETRLVWRIARSILYFFSSAIVVLTGDSKSYHSALLQRKIFKIPHFLDLEMKNSKIESNFSSHQPFIISIGRLEAQKRFDLVIKAFSIVQAQFKEWKLLIAGEGSLKAELQQIIRDLKLSERVFLLGHIVDSMTLLGQSEFLAMASDYEGFSLVALEAMALSKPVVFTNCLTGPQELIDQGKTGFLVPVGSVDELSKSFNELMQAPDLRRKMGEAAFQKSQNFSFEKIQVRWEELFSEIEGS